jgi:ubiquinone/menaquinone biosynthesis C-methylase UbiE
MTATDPKDPNREQIEYWNSVAGEKWVRLNKMLDTQLAVFGQRALDGAALKSGQRVLDVGCGCGDTTLEAAKRVGPGGQAVGLDVSQPMLELATQRANDAGLAQARFEQADAQQYSVEPANAFDACVSRFGIMFFSDPQAAFRQLHGVLKPSGRFSFLCWQALDKNPWIMVPAIAAASVLEMSPSADPYAPGPMSLADSDRTTGLLRNAGFHNVECESFKTEFTIGATGTVEGAVDLIHEKGPVAAALRDKDASTREAVREAVTTALTPYNSADGVRMGASVWELRGTATA